ncbi:MAG: N-acetyl-gamma-glutamyl-phosphate reductase [Tannerellaceae bacterium]|jgi:N-acetyl-gamma-glutamyl-phosphate reductase|nr:N-acetyl-gamma-glutamyl-phosphate reductase [Tannerellaceae bacterium]
MIRIGIVGGAGYTAGELIRLLAFHPHARIIFVVSESHAGKSVDQLHRLTDETKLSFICEEPPLEQIDLLFFCTPHGDTRKWIESHQIPQRLKIIDLSTDYRHAAEGNDFVYGLPELNRNSIRSAQHIANPGCFATCIQLAILPLAQQKLLNSDLHISALTGSTGAGAKPGPTTHFSWRTDNISIYKPFAHQHLDEIRQSLNTLQPDFPADIHFLPFRGDFARGIFAVSYIQTDEISEAEAVELYESFYSEHPFTFVAGETPDLKQAVNTNKCILHVSRIDRRLMIVSIIDNLLKGASGQAVQNMNLMFGLDETDGLNLKPSSF